jgi:Glycine-zipper domain
MTARRAVLPIIACLVLTACATVPTGPSVLVLPGAGKNFEQFQTEDAVCRQWALQQTGTTPNEAGAVSTVTGAAVGTAVGAGLGAAIGAAAGSPATGAAVGAGAGLFGGTAVGAGNAYGSSISVQQRFDIAYVQCMYAKGNQVPVSRGSQPAYTSSAAPPPPPPPPRPPGVPPPPAGTPPPPPPGPVR